MNSDRNSVRFTLTTASLIRIILVLLALYFSYLIRDILVILFTTVILTAAIDPWVDWMHKRGIKRSLGIVFIYIFLLGVFGTAIWLIIPPMVTQFGQLANDAPAYLERVSGYFATLRDYTASHGWLNQLRESLSNGASNLPSAAGGVFTTIFGFFGGIASFILILVITFYMSAEENSTKKLLWSLTPERHQDYVMDVFNRMQVKIGLWMRGQIILCFSIFALTYAGLSIMGVKYALILAIIAGLTEFIPYLGPMLGAVPAVFLAFTQSPVLGLYTIILYMVVQVVENNILVPRIMQKTAGLNPIISIVALMIGYSVGGVLGAILAIPVATAGMVVVDDLLHKKNSGATMEEAEAIKN